MRGVNEENDLQLKKFLIVKQILVTFLLQNHLPVAGASRLETKRVKFWFLFVGGKANGGY